MTTMVWLVVGSLVSAALVLALIRRFRRRAPARFAEKITSTP